MALTIQNFTDLTDPRFREIADGEMGKVDTKIDKIYGGKESSTLETERGSAVTPLPLYSDFTSSGQVTYRTPVQGFDWSATHVEYSQGIAIQRRLWQFDQFGVIENYWRKLIRSADETLKEHAAKIIEDGPNVSSLLNFSHTRGEALFANTHSSPVSGVGSTNTDTLVTTALSRTSLNTIRTMMLRFVDDQGFTHGLNADVLFVPPELLPTAEVLIQSSMEPDTGNNAINPNKGRLEIVVLDALSDTNDYFVGNKAAMHDSFHWYEAVKPEFDRVMDFDTKQAKYSGYMAHTIAWSDWRVGVYAQVS